MTCLPAGRCDNVIIRPCACINCMAVISLISKSAPSGKYRDAAPREEAHTS